MKCRAVIRGLLFVCGVIVIQIHTVGAEPRGDVPPFEKPYLDGGFKSVEEALQECETLHHKELKLPYKLPPIAFTHHFGSCYNDKEYHKNDELGIEYLHEKKGENHYKIDVRPSSQKLNFEKSRRIKQSYTLQDGNRALYMEMPIPMSKRGFNILVFEKDGWQYLLSIDSRVEDKVTVHILLEIANSIK
ncbi:hypothetical protein [Paenibacillus sp. 2TAB19]|uniref:hypothetical protein n=1 Tax=Paenibacillus sp. 2TAB19 TaxID=3233003 RepID=UPI003F9D0369